MSQNSRHNPNMVFNPSFMKENWKYRENNKKIHQKIPQKYSKNTPKIP